MGAFILAFPRERIKTLLTVEIFARVTVVPAVFLLGFWFLLQVFSQLGSIAAADVQDGGVAYMAHIGGFIFGAITWRLFESAQGRRHQPYFG